MSVTQNYMYGWILSDYYSLSVSTNSGKYDSRPSEDVFDGGRITGYEYNYDYDYRDQRCMSLINRNAFKTMTIYQTATKSLRIKS